MSGRLPFRQVRREQHPTAAGRGLRVVQRDVRVSQELGRRPSVLRGEGDPDAGRDPHRTLGEGDRPCQGPDQAARQFGCSRGIDGTALEDGELVAAEPGKQVVRAQLLGEPAAYGEEQLVACGMSEAVVHLLEAVEIEDVDRATSGRGP